MKLLGKYLLRGVIFFLPFALTIYIFVIMIRWFESWAASAILSVLPDLYIPGLGLLLTLSFLILVGFIVSLRSFGRIIFLMELPFKNVPIIKSIYLAIRNLADYFSPDGENMSQQVVTVKHPDFDIEVVGFLTRSDLSNLPEGFPKNDKVAVYIPLSYQIGGNTIFVPRAWVRKVNMPVEHAMRMALTAWMDNSKKK